MGRNQNMMQRGAKAMGGNGEIAPPQVAGTTPYLASHLPFARNMGRTQPACLKSESLLQHYAQFALEVIENTVFLAIVPSREVDIALSWGQGGKDHRKPCINRGRQIQWYKDFLLSRSQRLWRLLPFLAAKTVRRCRSRRMQQHNSRSITTSWFTSAYCFGRACGPVHPAPHPNGGAIG